MIRGIHYQLKNQGEFKIAHGSRSHTDTLIVEISKGGIQGLGEAAHIPYYPISIEQSLAQLTEHNREIASVLGSHPAVFWEIINHLFPENHFLKCALDMAHYDWLSKKAELSLGDFIKNSDYQKPPASSFTLGIDTSDNTIEKARLSNFKLLKIKLSGTDDDVIIQNLRAETDKNLYVDANSSWKSENAGRFLLAMEKAGVLLIEQPFAKEEHGAAKALSEQTNLPIIADESCVSYNDIAKCHGFYDGINIKLSKCGGIYQALLMVKEARRLGMKVMLGCMTESSIGISAAAHLASLADFVDLDGALMIANDPAEGVMVKPEGYIFKNTRWGHGALLKNGL